MKQHQILATKTKLIALAAAASVGATALLFSSAGFAQGRSEPLSVIEISGKAVMPARFGAIVTATVAGRQFRVRSDEQGNYRMVLRLPASLRDAVVSLRADGRRGEAAAGVSSYIGSLAQLQALAGVDAVVNGEENPRLQISAISSAELALVNDALGHAPKTGDELVTAVASLDASQLIDLAATLRLMATDASHNPLPEGVADSADFLARRKLRAEYVKVMQTQAPDLLAAAALQLASNPEQHPAASARQLPGQLMAVQSPARLQTSLDDDRGLVALQLNADGSGSLRADRHFSASSWAIRNGQIAVTPVSPAQHETTAWLDTNQDGSPDAAVRELHSAVQTRISLLGNGMALVATQDVISHPERPTLANETTTSLKAVRLISAEQYAALQGLTVASR